MYSEEPEDKRAFTQAADGFYTRFAALYDVAAKFSPLWKGWLLQALPHLQGPRVLEVSCGTGYLLTQYAGRFEVHGVDLNERMVETARRNLEKSGVSASLLRANVEALPFRDNWFDSVLNTMAFSGYPDGARAMSELARVLKPGGRLVMVVVNYPADGNWLGTRLTELWKYTGDVIRDVGRELDAFGLEHTDTEIGGFGSVHLYVATKAG